MSTIPETDEARYLVLFVSVCGICVSLEFWSIAASTDSVGLCAASF